jgi:hypothetical protein
MVFVTHHKYTPSLTSAETMLGNMKDHPSAFVVVHKRRIVKTYIRNGTTGYTICLSFGTKELRELAKQLTDAVAEVDRIDSEEATLLGQDF